MHPQTPHRQTKASLRQLTAHDAAGTSGPAPDRACGHGSSVNMLSHIYMRNRRACVLVITVGEPEAFVNGEDVYLLCGKGELIRHEPQPR
jgi:hypothetical protein